jgi:transcriptional regulator with XRE-family HTH domain
MDFHFLQIRLIAHMQRRVSNGEITERSLARLSGVSQPHLHNVLKGTRSLSPDMADQILRCLRIDLLDLAASADVRACPREGPLVRNIPCLEGLLGPQHPFPAHESRAEAYPFPAADLEGLESAVAVRLAPDPAMVDLFSGGDLVLLDRSERRRMLPDAAGFYALDFGGASAIRRVRQDDRRLYPPLRDCPDSPSGRPVSGLDRSLLVTVRGRVARLIRQL